MMTYTGDRTDVAQFVDDLLWNGRVNFQSITITKLEKSEDYSVAIAIDGLWEDIVERLVLNSLGPLTRI